MNTAAVIILSIWASWELLTLAAQFTRQDVAIFAAPLAGLAAALFGVWYY